MYTSASSFVIKSNVTISQEHQSFPQAKPQTLQLEPVVRSKQFSHQASGLQINLSRCQVEVHAKYRRTQSGFVLFYLATYTPVVFNVTIYQCCKMLCVFNTNPHQTGSFFFHEST